ncbi:hypothetical protein ACNPQM_00700 [Streptomyces sp. NPDC056231]
MIARTGRRGEVPAVPLVGASSVAQLEESPAAWQRATPDTAH